MKKWDVAGPPAPVRGVPVGCRAVPLVDLVERAGELVETRDRRRRRKTAQVILTRDPAYPPGPVADDERSFAVGAGKRRWSTVVGRYGDRSSEVALTLVRGGVVHLACDVDGRGRVGNPRWWQPTEEAASVATRERAVAAEARYRRRDEHEMVAKELEGVYPGVAAALRAATTAAAAAVLGAAARDLVEGIAHAGPRAFAQAHFGSTKVHDVRAILTAAGVPVAVLDQLGLRRGDRIGVGGPIVLATADGCVDVGPLRGPVTVRLDQPGLAISTLKRTVVVIENLQPAEAVCARHRELPVIYTAGQFGDDAAVVLGQLATAGRRLVVLVDSDLGGIRIAKRVLEAAPSAEVVDVGMWAHPPRPRFAPHSTAVRGLRGLVDDPSVGWFASAVLERGYPVEQELATLEILQDLHLLNAG